ncbi:MAG: TetR/AcrR family transcriptional regulator [Myxococcales bacterium]|nr:TetR/AcrR family transcriptional regulator [Myxococcales bacterium]
MAKSKHKVPPPRKPAKSHDELPRHADWQNPRVVQILDAASRCFSREGLANTTIQEIAVEAGLTKSMIHYYFESKQVLILELQAFVHERYFRRVQQRLEVLSAAANSEDRLQAALWEVYEIVNDKQLMRLQLEMFAEAGRDPYMKTRMTLALDRSQEFIEAGAEQVVNAGGAPSIRLPRALSLLIASTLLGLRVQEFVTGESEQSKQAYKLFLAMLTGAMGRERAQGGPPKPERPAFTEVDAADEDLDELEPELGADA